MTLNWETEDISQGEGGWRTSSTRPITLAKPDDSSQVLWDWRDWSPWPLSQDQSGNQSQTSTLLRWQQQPRTLILTDWREESLFSPAHKPGGLGPRGPGQKCCEGERTDCTQQARASSRSGWFPVALVSSWRTYSVYMLPNVAEVSLAQRLARSERVRLARVHFLRHGTLLVASSAASVCPCRGWITESRRVPRIKH